MKKIISVFLYLVLAGIVGITASYAVDKLTAPGPVANTMYSLIDIYNLGVGTTSPLGTGAIQNTPVTVEPTGYSLTDVYTKIANEINAIDITKILTGTTIFGKTGTMPASYTYGDNNQAYVLGTATAPGTALKNLWNGTNTAGTILGGSQLNGGIEDYNAGGSAASGRYVGSWTQCVIGNSYCNTNDSGAAYRDNSTGLVWSKSMHNTTWVFDDSNGNFSWFKANNCTETTGSVCTKKVSSKTGCEANTGWYLPTQKQLMQAYIDGAYGNLGNSANDFWSSTSVSVDLTFAWPVNLTTGIMYDNYTGVGYSEKTGTLPAHCVR